MKRQYKFVYLWNYAINLFFVVAMAGVYTGAQVGSWMKHFIETGVSFWGVMMVLFLFSRAFAAGDDYQGRRLDGRTTALLTVGMTVVNLMLIYIGITGHEAILTPAMVILGAWGVAFVGSIVHGRLMASASDR